MDVFEAIKNRRSIRRFINKPVEEEKLVKVLDTSRWAPSSGNIQDIRIVVVKDKNKKTELAEAAYGQYWLASAPVILVITSKLDKMARMYGERGKELFSIQNTSAAVQNMLLSAHALGLGTCWVGSFDEDMVERTVRIPREFKTLAMVALGYPAEQPNPPHRMSLEGFVFFEEYKDDRLY